MAAEVKPVDWRVILWAGVFDLALGVVLIAAGLTGVIAEDGVYFALFGGLLLISGVAVILWARNKMSQAGGLGGRQD